jgi:hypothetical protein
VKIETDAGDLPNFSSHSCSVSVTVEIPDVSVVAQESSKLYALLQTAVDGEIQQVGYMPDASTYREADEEGYFRTSWQPIETAAIELMKSGRCKVKCSSCEKRYDGFEIDYAPWEAWVLGDGDFHGGGSAGENFFCPERHLLCENITGIA